MVSAVCLSVLQVVAGIIDVPRVLDIIREADIEVTLFSSQTSSIHERGELVNSIDRSKYSID